MTFVAKATYRNETRKFTFNEPYFPSYQDLYHQLYRVFAVGQSYYLSKLLFSPQDGTRILIGMEAHSAAEYDNHTAPFKGRAYPGGRLTFSVYDETPHKVPVSRVPAPGSFIHPIPPVPPIPFFAPPPPPPPPVQSHPFSPPHNVFNPPPPPPPNMFIPPPPPPPLPHFFAHRPEPPSAMDVVQESESATSRVTATATGTECCSVSEGKKEVRSMMVEFLHDFTRVMGTTFGEEASFFDPLQSPPRSLTPHARTPVPMDLDASLNIPGSFIQARPNFPDTVEDDANVEKSQTPPQLESLLMSHPNIWCDFCGKQIKGLRFKCQECAEYDLCANCIVANQALDKHNADQPWIHRFTTISPPTRDDPAPRLPIVFQAQQASASAPGALGPPVHSNITCDMCIQTVVGNRHKCLDCPDFDLCDNCIGHAPTQHPLHEFLKLETPGRVIVHTVGTSATRPPFPVTHSARCDLCDSRIIGDRYKCTNCPDFDTCASCFVITPEHHPSHIFVKVTRPADIMSRPRVPQVQHFATCDGCNKNIVGVRYKCMHAGCPDFDLCENCEALPIAVHPATHPFLKIKSLDTRIPTVPRNIPHRATPSPVEHRAFPDVPTTVPESAPVVISSPSLPASTPVERLNAIRMQAERRLSARMQQLQSYPFADGTPNRDVDPVIEQRLIRERKEAEEKAQMMDRELEELEQARQKKHQEALKQSCMPYLDSVKAALNDSPEDFRSILKLWIDYFDAKDSVSSAYIAQELRASLAGYPDLLEGLDAFILREAAPPPRSPSPPASEQGTSTRTSSHLEETVSLVRPEMSQRTSSFFASPLIHPLESPLQATFISDNNVPDGHIFPAGAEFVKSWRVKNDGSEAWAEGTELVFVGGMRLGAFEDVPRIYDVGEVAPGEVVDVCAGDMKAPEVSGRYTSHWRLRDPQGRPFGHKMWCDIEVLEIESDNSQHGSLVNSAVVMPETAPAHAPSVGAATNPFSGPSSPITVPSSAITISDGASSDGSSVGSVSLVDQADSDWEEVADAPSPRHQPPRRNSRGDDEVEYLVLYDSASDEA